MYVLWAHYFTKLIRVFGTVAIYGSKTIFCSGFFYVNEFVLTFFPAGIHDWFEMSWILLPNHIEPVTFCHLHSMPYNSWGYTELIGIDDLVMSNISCSDMMWIWTHKSKYCQRGSLDQLLGDFYLFEFKCW